MFSDIIHTFLLSISPFGEARVGIPFGIINGMHPLLAFTVGLIANLLVFPIFIFLLQRFNKNLWRFHLYRKHSLKLARRSKKLLGDKLNKYGFWGLMIFVMIPLPVTGAYMGTIAAYIFRLKPGKALTAVSLGVLISCTLVATGVYFGKKGIELI
ncbi:MAG: COG2426 family protein [Owenweeksia sp.]